MIVSSFLLLSHMSFLYSTLPTASSSYWNVLLNFNEVSEKSTSRKYIPSDDITNEAAHELLNWKYIEWEKMLCDPVK